MHYIIWIPLHEHTAENFLMHTVICNLKFTLLVVVSCSVVTTLASVWSRNKSKILTRSKECCLYVVKFSTSIAKMKLGNFTTVSKQSWFY